MRDFLDIRILQDMTILQAIEIIDASAQQIGLVMNKDNELLGTLTDGDIRRGLLKGISLEQSVSLVMNVSPTVVHLGESRDYTLALMKQTHLRQIPIVDQNNRVVGLETIDNLLVTNSQDNWIILMAGGLGTRLGDLTRQCPKPLIQVGGKPLLETIVGNFKEYGFHNIFLSVNYKAEMIESYFKNGSELGVNINYLHEQKRLGTAGALSLLKQKPDKPIIIMNGDLLTKINFQQLLDYHIQHKGMATMCVRAYSYQVPYGVVRIEGERLMAIDEKPVQDFFVNAGIYVLEPEALQWIPENSYYDMPSLFEELISKGMQTNVFPIREYWIDIGQRDDLDLANGQYQEVFG